MNDDDVDDDDDDDGGGGNDGDDDYGDDDGDDDDDDDGDWVFPPFDQNTFLTLFTFLVGSILVVFFLRFDRIKSQKKGS